MTVDFTRIADPNRLLNATRDDAIQFPYWAELWDSALAVALHLTDHRPLTPGHFSTLDLGCGMGFAGTVAARLGHRVLFADLDPDALLFAQINNLHAGARVRTRRVNWHTDQLGESFDLILGADIIYERKQWESLETFWRAHLAPDGQVLLGEPGRPSGDLFQPWIRQKGWTLQMINRNISRRESPIRLFLLRPPLSPGEQSEPERRFPLSNSSIS